MLTRLALGFAWLLHFFPLRVINWLGQGIGLLFLMMGRERREVTRTNLELCFPLKTAAERESLLRSHYRAFGRAVLESTICWWGSKNRIRRMVNVEGEQNLNVPSGKRAILLAPHFTGIEQAAMRMVLDYPLTAIYARQKNAVFDRFLAKRRLRFGVGQLLLRQEGVKAMIRSLREGNLLQLSPDLDLGPKDSIFDTFFGVPAATVTVLPRIARICDAAIVPVIVTQLPASQGYRVRIFPEWENYPSGDLEADVRRMNAFIEERIREQPAHYMWMHKRFKTRPSNEHSPYT